MQSIKPVFYNIKKKIFILSAPLLQVWRDIQELRLLYGIRAGSNY